MYTWPERGRRSHVVMHITPLEKAGSGCEARCASSAIGSGLGNGVSTQREDTPYAREDERDKESSMGTNAELYDHDFYAWVQAQAALLKARQFDALDLDNLIEEVESIARQERHLLWHRFRTLLTHLVAWWGERTE